MYYTTTKKETIERDIYNIFAVIKKEHFKVIKLENRESDSVIFQIVFKKRFTLENLLRLGLASHNPSIIVSSGNVLVTWIVEDIKPR